MTLTPEELSALTLSLKIATLVALLGLVPATAIAFYLARRQGWVAQVVNSLIHLPLVLPPVVTGYLLLILFGRKGPIGGFLEAQFGIVLAFRWTGAVLAAGIMALPLIVRPLRLAFEATDPKLVAAARTLGASRIAAFATVSLPLAMPGILAGLIMGFAKSLGEFGATITFVSNIPFETQTMPLAIYSFLQVPGGDSAALRLSLIAVAISIGALLASELVNRAIARRLGRTDA